MSIIGLEISDAGIMAAGSAANSLLAVDGKALESPGFALSEKICSASDGRRHKKRIYIRGI